MKRKTLFRGQNLKVLVTKYIEAKQKRVTRSIFPVDTLFFICAFTQLNVCAFTKELIKIVLYHHPQSF